MNPFTFRKKCIRKECMSVKSPLGRVLYCYFNMSTINKNLKFNSKFKLKELKKNKKN